MTKLDTDRSPMVRIEVNASGRATRRMVGQKAKRKPSTVVTDLVTTAPARAARRAEADAADAARARAIKKLLKPTRTDDAGPTRLTAIKQQPSSFERMLAAKEIDGTMLQAAQEIEAVVAAVAGSQMVKGYRIEPRSGGVATPLAERVAIAHARRYLPWARELTRRRDALRDPTLDCVLSVLVDRESCTSLDRRHRMASGRAKYLVRRGLLEYAQMAGWAPRDSVEKFDSEHRKFTRPARVSEAAAQTT